MRELICQEDSGREIDLKEIQESRNDGTSNIGAQTKGETHVESIDESIPHRLSSRVSVPTVLYGFHITAEGDMFISDSTL